MTMTGPRPALPFVQVARVIAGALRIEPARVTPCATLTTDLACDSLDRQTIAADLDTTFGIEIPDDDISEWRTALDAARSVARLAARQVA